MKKVQVAPPPLVTLGLDPRAHDPLSTSVEGRDNHNLYTPHACLIALHHCMDTRVKPEYDDVRAEKDHLTLIVIPVKTGIQQRAVRPAKKPSPSPNHPTEVPPARE